MTVTAQSKMTLPAEGEVKAAVQGQRALAAYLATQFETQHIQIFDDQKQAHQVELPTSALVLVLLPNPTNIADNTSARRASCIMSASMWLRSTVMLISLSCTASAIRTFPR